MEESFEDDLLIPDQPDSPVSRPKLRRLKKGTQSGPLDPPTAVPDLHSPPDEEAPAAPKTMGARAPEDCLSEPGDQIPGSNEVGTETCQDLEELDPLFPDPSRWEPEDMDVAREVEDFDRGGAEVEKVDDESAKAKSAKKRLNMDGGGETTKKKNKCNSGEKTKESARERKRLEMERKTQLVQLHVQSQRLLRETRDASFKPVPLVQKPISSVLEKIRHRKLEMLRSCNILNHPESTEDTTEDKADTSHDVDPSVPENEKKDLSSNEASNPTFEDADQASAIDKEDISNDASQDTLLELPTHIATDVSSSQEDDNEDEELHPLKIVNMDSYSEDGPVKAFVDDEAEEEDDSDHDLMRFRDDEEDDEIDEQDELNDLIASDFEEAPIDYAKHNQLHQKWLEQQDATATDNVLQRLRCKRKQKETTFSEEEENEEAENEETSEEFGDEETYDLTPTNAVRQNRKMAKQMIAKLYTDDDGTYVPSDDEETEQTLIRHRLQKHNEESTISSVADDKHSREVFGLIKKMNVAPESKKRVKHTSSFDMMIMRGNNSGSSKASFLGRATSSSIQSSHKHVSTAVRAYIFGRDDSNSKSSLSVPESVQDMDHMQNQQKKPSAKFSGSQVKSSTAPKTTDAQTSSGSSLFQILRQSSICLHKQMDGKTKSSKKTMETEAAHQFSAFKLRRFSNV